MALDKSPAPKGDRASRVSFGDWTLRSFNPSDYRAQYMIATRGIRRELASMMATLAFGDPRDD